VSLPEHDIRNRYPAQGHSSRSFGTGAKGQGVSLPAARVRRAFLRNRDAPAEGHFPVILVYCHGLLAVTTLVLVLLDTLRLGS
jgi:hypothetical protein